MAIKFLIAPTDAEIIGEHYLNIISETFANRINNTFVEIEVDLLPPEEMQALNLQHRSVDCVTDVLSFPLQDTLEGLPDTMPVLLGSVILCPEEAALRQETLPQLVVHGIFHLLGSDHETDLNSWLELEREVLLELHSKGIDLQGTEDW